MLFHIGHCCSVFLQINWQHPSTELTSAYIDKATHMGTHKASLQVLSKTGWLEEKLSSSALKIDSKLSSFFFCNKVCSTGVRKPWRELQNSEWGKDCGDTHDIICSIYELLYHFISKKYFPWILIRRQTCYTDKSKSLSISTICIDLIKHCNTEMKVLANRKEVNYPSFKSH